jgi:hypothetical protein
MRRIAGHRSGYHDWPNSTPMIDVVRTLVAVASVVIGGYALVFMAFAVRDTNWGLAAKYGPFLIAVGLANGLVDVVRRWRRHHG